jgi:ribosomal protein L4
VQKLRDGAVTVVDQLSINADDGPKTKRAVELLAQLGVVGRAVLVDVKPDDHFERSVRNIPRVQVVRSSQLTARDVVGSARVVMTKACVEHLAKVLAS